MKRFDLRAVLALGIFAIAALACSLANDAATSEPTQAPTKFARAALLDTPVSPPPTTLGATAEPSPEPKPGITPSGVTPRPGTSSPTARAVLTASPTPLASPTRTSLAPTATRTASGCPTLPPPALKPSGLVKSVQLGTLNNSVLTPTNVFQPSSDIHAVVTVQNAPANTRVKAAWYANDVGKAAPCNAFVDSAELTNLEGAFNVDFSLDHPNPVGAYRVEIFLNGNLDQVVPFSIR